MFDNSLNFIAFLAAKPYPHLPSTLQSKILVDPQQKIMYKLLNTQHNFTFSAMQKPEIFVIYSYWVTIKNSRKLKILDLF